MVAGEAVEFFLERLVVEGGEWIDAILQGGLEAEDAAEIPSGGEELR